MGYTSYSSVDRSTRAVSKGYHTKSADDIFVQNRLSKIHESMKPSGALLRESRDSKEHPNTVPIIIALDETGSMGKIPHLLIKDGLPKMVSNMIQKGIADPTILFLGIGDHEVDKAPLQVGQFESGDEELDLWLERTWLERGGGANAGESYHLAWYFAGKHTITDSFEKRGQKGYLFTIGDEPCLTSLPKNVVEELMGEGIQAQTFSSKELLEAAQEKYEVFHLHMMESHAAKYSIDEWKERLGQRCIEVEDQSKVGEIIADIVVNHVTNQVSHVKVDPVITDDTQTDDTSTKPSSDKEEEMLM